MLSGTAEYNDNGVWTTIEQGDVTFTPSGTGHGINNTSDKPLEIIALIIYS
ncbi:MAG: cupin domain-containing protein [Candidatus Ornithospirochaeta sp.]